MGTAFHAELTRKESIFLKGAILGLSRREVDGRSDEIVEFSEIEKLIETPVNHYSGGT